jgi:hypothetical protein
VINNAATGDIVVDHFLAAINTGGAAAGDVPAETVTAGSYLTFMADNARYAGSFSQSDLAAFANLVKAPANWFTHDDVVSPVFTNASAFQTPLVPNDLLFMAVDGNGTDAHAFVLLKAVVAGTQICFSDKNYGASASPAWPSNEAVYTWTADVAYPLGTIVTVQTATPVVNRGSVVGTGGGVSTTAETCYAFVGTIEDADTGNIVVDTFLASVNTAGASAGDAPASLASAGTAFTFSDPNVQYTGSLDTSDTSFASWVKDPANWDGDAMNGYPLTGGSLFPRLPLPAVEDGAWPPRPLIGPEADARPR